MLENCEKSAGSYELKLSVSDLAGGVYFVRFEAVPMNRDFGSASTPKNRDFGSASTGEYKDTKKIVLLK